MSCSNRQSLTASPLDYLRLFRIPNVFTAVADVTMGFLSAQASLAPWGSLACLIASSGLLYTAGMVLNDVYDVQVDAVSRPERPLPAGRISVQWARSLGFVLLLLGVGFGWLAGLPLGTASGFHWRCGAIATALALCIVSYDALLKRTPLGPVLMGGCRFLNVLLGASVQVSSVQDWSLGGFQPHQLLAAAGIGVYIVGVTWFARRESESSTRLPLFGAAGVMAVGIAILCLIHPWVPVTMRAAGSIPSQTVWILLLSLLAFTILRRCAVAIADPTPYQVQLAVKVGILSIIVLDAAVALEVSHWHYAVGLLVLLVPTVVIGKWVYST
jgi:4-hydroxybenzoate polyprenyltransferase